jgi:hypothetical protein
MNSKLEYTEAKMIELRKLRVKYHEAGMQIKELKQDAITKSRVNEEILSDYRKQIKELEGKLLEVSDKCWGWGE